MPVEVSRARDHRALNAAHSAALLLAMGGQAALLGYIVGGPLLAGAAVGLAISGALAVGRRGGAILLRMYGARPLTPERAPGLTGLVEVLAKRAGLPVPPALYWIPSSVPNALSTGGTSAPAVAVTDGLLRQLEPRELAGVLAHEIGHIANGDLLVMGLADGFARFTAALGQVGMLVAVLGALGGDSGAMWIGMLLAAGPSAATLLQLALSRTREFAADLTAAELTGDPDGLISALVKIERPTSIWQRLLGLPGRDPNPSLLRTHPATAERIARLRALRGEPRPALPEVQLQHHMEPVRGRPRVRSWGTWY